MQFFWWIIFSLSFVIFISLCGIFFPKKFFCLCSFAKTPLDRGIKCYKQEGNRCIIYEPNPLFHQYIPRYILAEREGGKVFVGELNRNFKYLDYDIILFNARGKAFKAINVKESPMAAGYTSTTPLPKKTAFATLVINAADDASVAAINKKLPRDSLVKFGVAVCLLSILEVFVAKLCLAALFGDVFSFDFMTDAQSILLSLALGILAALISLGAMTLHLLLKLKSKGGQA